MNRWDFIKIKCFCTEKETVNKSKRQPAEGKEIFAKDTADKVLISKMQREQTRFNIKQQII